MKYRVTGFILLTSFMSCNLGSETVSISSNTFFRNNGRDNRMIMSKNVILYKTTIYPDVINHAFNDDFIIAKQIPIRSNFTSYLGFDLYMRYTRYLHYLENPDVINEEGYKRQKGKIEGDSINYEHFHARGASDKNSSEDMHISRAIADSLIDNDPYYQKIFAHEFNYWIIDNRRDTLIGPLSKEEYLTKREELHVPDELQLEE